MESLIVLLIGIAIAVVKAKTSGGAKQTMRRSQPGVPRNTQTQHSVQESLQNALKNYQAQQNRRNQMRQQSQPNRQSMAGSYQSQPNRQNVAGSYQSQPNRQSMAGSYQSQPNRQSMAGSYQNQPVQQNMTKVYQDTKGTAVKKSEIYGNNDKQMSNGDKVQDDTILERANDNLTEFEGEENLDVLSQVNDMMIMGFTGELTFERDFISEGIEMLNRYELPDSVEQLTTQYE